MRHLSRSELHGFVDGELSTKRRSRVAEHLAACLPCRNTVASIQALDEQARSIPTQKPPAAILQRVLARRAAGERVILPLSDPFPALPKRLGMIAAALVALVGAGALLVRSLPDLGAERVSGELILTPEKPERGDLIAVEYRSTSMLAGEARLVLRARYRTAADREYDPGARQIVVAQLEKVGRRRFEGSVQLPDSVVYAVFAVEDTLGARVDSNRGALWELLVFNGDEPDYRALVQQQNDLSGRNWQGGLEAARRATEVYPDDPDAWSRLAGFEKSLSRSRGMTDFSGRWSARYEELHSRFANDISLSGDTLAGLYWLGFIAEQDPGRVDYWRDRLLTEAPGHPQAVQQRVFRIIAAHGSDRDGALRELEGLWQEVGAVSFQLPRMGLSVALRAGDPDAILRWADRRVALKPWAALAVAKQLAELPELRRVAVERLRDELARTDTDAGWRRPLTRTIGEQRRYDEAEGGRVLAPLGRALVQLGDTEAGLDALDQAAATGWDTEVFGVSAEVRLGIADTAGAVGMLARLAVDPNTTTTARDSLAALATGLVNGARWTELTRVARDEMYERVLGGTSNTFVRGGVELTDSAGASHRLDELTGGQVTLVAFWSWLCAPCLSELPRLQQVTARYEPRGVRVLILTAESQSLALNRFVQEHPSAPRVFHVDGKARDALGLWETPLYLVLDKSSRIRLSENSLDEIVRVLEALTAPTAVNVADDGS